MKEATTTTPYRVVFHNVGGSEPDGTPTYIGPWTFSTKMVRDVVEGALKGRVLNACAGKTKLQHNGEVIRNDLNPDREADYHTDVEQIDAVFDEAEFDTVVFDPPFDQTQSDEHYDGMHAQTKGPARKKLAKLVTPGGVFIECGWNDHSPGMAWASWQRKELHYYRRGPCHHPMLLTIDEKTSMQTQL